MAFREQDPGWLSESDEERADRVYGKLAALIEREVPTLRPGDADRHALEWTLEHLRQRVPRGPRIVQG